MKVGDLVDHIIKRSEGSQRFIIAVAGVLSEGFELRRAGWSFSLS